MNCTIDDIYRELHRVGKCTSRSEFSLRWLGKNESYFRSIQAKGLQPSAEAELTLAARLRDLGMTLASSEHAEVAGTGELYLQLYGTFLDALLDRAYISALDWILAD